MKGKENPSLILAFHGMLGRKKQTSLLLILLTMVFSFLTAATIYSGSSAQALQDTRCELYGEWQYLRLSDTDTDAAQVRENLPASAKVGTAMRDRDRSWCRQWAGGRYRNRRQRLCTTGAYRADQRKLSCTTG